jgi:argonaute-like protein
MEQVHRNPRIWCSQRLSSPSCLHCCGEEVKFIWFLAPNITHDATRHHIRFFQGPGPKYALVQCFTFFSYSTLSIKDKTGNVFGGLVVDKDVTSPNKSDFYLQSHPGLKGSECPQKSPQHNCLLILLSNSKPAKPLHRVV